MKSAEQVRSAYYLTSAVQYIKDDELLPLSPNIAESFNMRVEITHETAPCRNVH